MVFPVVISHVRIMISFFKFQITPPRKTKCRSYYNKDAVAGERIRLDCIREGEYIAGMRSEYHTKKKGRK